MNHLMVEISQRRKTGELYGDERITCDGKQVNSISVWEMYPLNGELPFHDVFFYFFLKLNFHRVGLLCHGGLAILVYHPMKERLRPT